MKLVVNSWQKGLRATVQMENSLEVCKRMKYVEPRSYSTELPIEESPVYSYLGFESLQHCYQLGDDVSKERLERLLVEVAHAALWDRPKPVANAWCFTLEKKDKDYNRLIRRCEYCSESFRHCPRRWGFLVDDPSDPHSTPTILVDDLASTTAAFYDDHYNVIAIDCNHTNRIEDLLAHEYIHFVLHKLFPQRRWNLSRKFDNIADKVEDSKEEEGNFNLQAQPCNSIFRG